MTPKELAADVKASLPTGVSVKTGEQAAADATAETADAIGSFLTPVLLAFAGVSVFVGALTIIFNAFSITVAQRRREFAMLRALGASRRQVLTSVVAEALSLGVLASAIGIVAGLGVAKGINALFKAVGADIPTAGIALEPRTILIAVLVGVGVTLLSALAPAMRATRVPPVAALQEGAALPPTRFTKFSTAIALVFAALGGSARSPTASSPTAGQAAASCSWASAPCCSSSPSPCWPSSWCGRRAGSSAGRWNGWLPPAAVSPATTPGVTRAARPPRPPRS